MGVLVGGIGAGGMGSRGVQFGLGDREVVWDSFINIGVSFGRDVLGRMARWEKRSYRTKLVIKVVWYE